jgi:mevalonate kinase
VALETERRQHGRPSGVDHLTVLHGGVQWFERDASGALAHEALDLAGSALEGLSVFHTGTPEETTGQMVEGVRQRFESRPDELDALLDGMEDDVRRLRSLLVGSVDEAGLTEVFRSYERRLEALGVVPATIQEVIRSVERAGEAAKISGAGGRAGSAAGSLLAYHPGASLPPAALEGFRHFEVPLGVEGLVLEIDS